MNQMQRIVDGFIDLEVGFVEDLLFRFLPFCLLISEKMQSFLGSTLYLEASSS